jgi:hypothetical protein
MKIKLTGRHCTFLLFFSAVYVLFQKSGLFGTRSATFTEIFFSPPFLVAATALGFCFVTFSAASRGTLGRKGWLVPLAAILVVLGLWTSFLTRIDLELVVTEDQSVVITADNARTFGGYAGRFARFPDLYIKLLTLTPEYSADREKVRKLAAEYVLLTQDGKPPQSMKRASYAFPVFKDGFLVSFKEHGYSPRYVLKGAKGEHLDSAFVYLKIDAPGTEDYFRLMSPHTYYLRYYPAGAGGSKEPGFNLRVSRNKDLVLDREVKLNEEVLFDGENISFPEVKQWTKFRIVRDYGQMIGFFGLACLGAWGVLGGIGWNSNRRRKCLPNEQVEVG